MTRGYTGHEHDPETGLVNMGARMYDARIGRFASPDFGVQVPGWAQAHNKYAYAWNNPYSWVDPFGLENEGTCEGMGAGECIPLDLGVITPNPTITYEQLQGLLEPDISQSYPNAHDVPLDVQSAYTRTPRESAFEEFERISDDRRTDEQKAEDLVNEALEYDPDAWRQLPSMRGLALLTGDDPATREALLREKAYREALRISIGKPLEAAATVATVVIPEALGGELIGAIEGATGGIRVTEAGIARVEGHLERLGALGEPENAAMIGRLKAGETTPHDINFYMHELKESAIMRRSGGYGSYEGARAAHLKTLQWQGIPYAPGYESQLYHPGVIRAYSEVFNPAAWPK